MHVLAKTNAPFSAMLQYTTGKSFTRTSHIINHKSGQKSTIFHNKMRNISWLWMPLTACW